MRLGQTRSSIKTKILNTVAGLQQNHLKKKLNIINLMINAQSRETETDPKQLRIKVRDVHLYVVFTVRTGKKSRI